MPVTLHHIDPDPDGDIPLIEVELSNDLLAVRLLDLGATLMAVRAADPATTGPGLCLAMPSVAGYRSNETYIGSTVGPVANRIAGAAFDVDGNRYRLEPNEGPNLLHSGAEGFHHKRWEVEPTPGDDEVAFILHRPAGQGGFPGNLDVVVTYRLDGNRLRYSWSAVTDAPTPVSITNHAYWNLAGAGTVHDHVLSVPAERVVDVNEASLPTGELVDVDGTDLDLRSPRRVGHLIERLDGQGPDHCYILDPATDAPIVLSHPASGRHLQVTTSMPGVQVYTGQHLDGMPRSGGHARHSGLCLETQHLPDAVNQPGFPSCIVRPEQPVRHITDYVFDL